MILFSLLTISSPTVKRLWGLVDLVQQAGAEVAGVGICIEKSFQPGHQLIEDSGIDIYSICRIASLENEEVTFLKENN